LFAIRPTTRADCEAFYGKALPYRIKAYTGLIDGEVVAIGGLGFPPEGPAIGFADLKDIARQWPYAVELHRFARRVIAEAKAAGVPRIVAMADTSIEAAASWLKRLGFEPLTDEGTLFIWRQQHSSQS
jgi:hypothetical protein